VFKIESYKARWEAVSLRLPNVFNENANSMIRLYGIVACLSATVKTKTKDARAIEKSWEEGS
jgi:hypothetical protein